MTGANEPGADPFAAAASSWTMSMDAVNAWTQTWQSLLAKRGSPAAEMMMGAAGTPAAWPQAILPLIAEMQQAFALPCFADLPRLDEALMPSPASAAEMTLLIQQYLAAAMPAWVKASEAFQAEIAARRAKGETVEVADGMDVWNSVLDRTLMSFNRSGDFAELQKRMLRLTMQQKQGHRKRAEMVAEALDMPTRTEMLDVYQRLHGLMREVHALRAEVRELKARHPD